LNPSGCPGGPRRHRHRPAPRRHRWRPRAGPVVALVAVLVVPARAVVVVVAIVMVMGSGTGPADVRTLQDGAAILRWRPAVAQQEPLTTSSRRSPVRAGPGGGRRDGGGVEHRTTDGDGRTDKNEGDVLTVDGRAGATSFRTVVETHRLSTGRGRGGRRRPGGRSPSDGPLRKIV
jgi:hypothetical protein